MCQCFKSIVPWSFRVLWNQYKNRRRFDVVFGKGATANNTFFEGKNKINSEAYLINSYLGLGSFISGNSKLRNVKVGRFCSIGRNVETGFGIHPKDFVSTHPCFYSLKQQAGFTFTKEQVFGEHKFADQQNNYYVVIGSDVWIGNDVKIMDGITIGDGAIIGMGSIVTKDIKPYTINVGIPAREIGKRFTDPQIAFLQRFKWWNKSIEEIERNAQWFLNIESFMKELAERNDR